MSERRRTHKKEKYEAGFPDLTFGLVDAQSNGINISAENDQPQPQGVLERLLQAFRRARTSPREWPEE